MSTPEHGPVGALAELAELLVGLESFERGEKEKKGQQERKTLAPVKKGSAAAEETFATPL